MELSRFSKEEQGKYPGTLLLVSRKEAIALIHSLSSQIVEDSSDIGRLESFTKDGEYFSISVMGEEEEEIYYSSIAL